jgi:hypothetical protein
MHSVFLMTMAKANIAMPSDALASLQRCQCVDDDVVPVVDL